MAGKSKSAQYYARNPEARKKKAKYDTKYGSTAKRKKYRADLARERRARGIMGKGGGDMSHVKGGGFKREAVSKNRARNGHGKNGRLAGGTGTRKQTKGKTSRSKR